MSGCGNVRYCQSCGARLARDNRLTQCAPCQSRVRSLALGPPDLPASFWESSPMRGALASWHIGQVIRAYRHHLDRFEAYLARIGVTQVRELSPAVLSAFVAERSGAGVTGTSPRC